MVEYRSDDRATEQLLSKLMDTSTALRVEAERAMNTRLNGGCQVPIAGFSELDDGMLTLEGRVASVDGRQLLQEQSSVSLSAEFVDAKQQAASLGVAVAEQLLAQGAQPLLDAVLIGNDA